MTLDITDNEEIIKFSFYIHELNELALIHIVSNPSCNIFVVPKRYAFTNLSELKERKRRSAIIRIVASQYGVYLSIVARIAEAK